MKPQRFYSRKDWKVALLFGISLLMPLLPFFLGYTMDTIMVLVFFTFSLLMGWFWFGTYYEVTPDYLYYFTGPFRGKIEIAKIKTITTHTYSLVGIRPTLTFDSMRVTYDYNEIYIAPEAERTFLNLLISLNSSIVVEEKK